MDVSLEIFWKFAQQPFCRALPVSNSFRFLSLPAECQLSVSFLDTCVFSEYFSLLELLAINVAKALRWRGAIIETIFNSINKWIFRNSLSILTWYKIFLCNISLRYFIIMKLELQIKATSRNFLGNKSVKDSLFHFFVGESNSLENSMREAKSIKHFKSISMHFFPLFSRCFQ